MFAVQCEGKTFKKLGIFRTKWTVRKREAFMMGVSLRTGSTEFPEILLEKKPEWLGVTSGNSSWGFAARLFKSWSYFTPNNFTFHTRFQTWPPRNYVIMRSLLRLEQQHKRLFKIHLEFAYSSFFLTRLESCGIETINTLIHSRRFLENHTRLQTKIGKVYTFFQTKKAQNPFPLGQHIPIWVI